jgi:hypothetical protein
MHCDSLRFSAAAALAVSSALACTAAPAAPATAAARGTTAAHATTAPRRTTAAHATPATAPAAGWSRPLIVGSTGGRTKPIAGGYLDGTTTRVALSADGAATVAWDRLAGKEDGRVRSLTGGRRLGPEYRLAHNGLVGVARDAAGNAIAFGNPGEDDAWLSTAGGSGWHTVALVPDLLWAFGGATGFVAGAASPVPKAKDEDQRTLAARTIAAGSTKVTGTAPSLPADVVPDDGAFYDNDDGSNWALSATGRPLTIGSSPAAGAPKDVTADESRDVVLIGLGDQPSVTPLPGTRNFDVSSIDTAGEHVAAAGLYVQLSGDFGPRGLPEYSLGTETEMSEVRRIPGVKAHRAVSVDVAARADGGAVVTWLEKSRLNGFSDWGVPRFAAIAPDGHIETSGRLSSETYARELRVVRVGTSMVAVWTHHTPGSKIDDFRSARIDAANEVTRLAPPASKPAVVRYAESSTQLVSAGDRAAFVYTDVPTQTIRLSTLQLR